MASLRKHGLFALEDVGVKLGEELLVQGSDGAQQVTLGHHEADIQQRSALADHADVDAIESIENTARHAGGMADIFAHQADDNAIVLHGDVGKLAQLAEDEIDARNVVDRERDADLAGGNHVDWRLIAVEDFENA